MSVSIYSYAGEVTVGVATDVQLIPDPERIVDAVHEELQVLAEAAYRRTAAPRARKRAKPPGRSISAQRGHTATAAASSRHAQAIPVREMN